jgi:hypothetical protein
MAVTYFVTTPRATMRCVLRPKRDVPDRLAERGVRAIRPSSRV